LVMTGPRSGQEVSMAESDQTPNGPMLWLPMAEAASRLGLTPAALRSRLRRGHYGTRKGNDGRVLVEVAADARPGQGQVTVTAEDELGVELDVLRREHAEAMERARREVEAARVAQARAEAERDSLERLIGELRAMLADARRPWWRRLVGA
jgi:hypothetical protein